MKSYSDGELRAGFNEKNLLPDSHIVQTVEVGADDMSRYRQIAFQRNQCTPEEDAAILFVGRIIQSAIDRAFQRDSVQISKEFNKKSDFNRDSFGGNVRSSKNIERLLPKSDAGTEP